ncbi:MAG: DUF1304 domain-containing protein [Prevotella sp.]
MHIVSQVLIILVSLLFLYIMYLETIATSSIKTSKVFNIPQEILREKYFTTLMKNQGVYNGLIALSLLYSVSCSENGKELSSILLVYCVLVAVYGALTSSWQILIKQGFLSFLALLSLIFL